MMKYAMVAMTTMSSPAMMAPMMGCGNGGGSIMRAYLRALGRDNDFTFGGQR